MTPTQPTVATIVAEALRDGARLRHATLDACGPQIMAAVALVAKAVAKGGKVLVFGNGGSAADAQHLASELVGGGAAGSDPHAAIALTVDSAALTAIANDHGFDQVFAHQVRALGAPGDVVIAMSTSGASANVLAGVEAARECQIAVIAMTGASGIAFAERGDVGIVVPSTSTARIQEIHLALGHVLCEALEAIASGERLPDGRPAGVDEMDTKLVSLDTLLAMRGRWRAEGRTVVWTSGVFDVLHAGHLASLRAAREYGDVLVVGVNGDDSVRALKGPTRPVFPADERAAMLAALEMVDHVLLFDEATPSAVLSRLRPEVHCKGAEYGTPAGKPMPEADVVLAYGGRVELLPLVAERSTTATLARAARGEEQ